MHERIMRAKATAEATYLRMERVINTPSITEQRLLSLIDKLMVDQVGYEQRAFRHKFGAKQ
jgi:hypothetical protein